MSSSAPTDGALALFVPDRDRLVPTDRARGPWSPSALHGGPVAALMARAAEREGPGDGEAGDHLQLARITLELLRPVPLAPLRVASKVVRPGRKVQLIDTVIESDGLEVAWSRALRIRVAHGQTPLAPTVAEDPAPPPPEAGVPRSIQAGEEFAAFHTLGMEMRFVRGAFDGPGPATAWFRLRCPVVLGELPTPWQRAAAAADFGNGIAAELDFGSSVFINPDLTVYLHRPPVGEWVCLDARTRFGTPGIGAAESELWDAEGRIGRAVQSLFVEVEG
jgi:acyl-coenzyme A thioesterase PaaI-like protein